MTIEMPVFVLQEVNIKKKTRTSKRKLKKQFNERESFDSRFLLPLVFPSILKSSDSFVEACSQSRTPIMGKYFEGRPDYCAQTSIYGKYDSFDVGPQIICESLESVDPEDEYRSTYMNFWPWFKGTLIQFTTSGYRQYGTEKYTNNYEIRFKPKQSSIKWKRNFECVLPFFSLHQNKDGCFPSSDTLELFAIALDIDKVDLKDLTIKEGPLYEEAKKEFLKEHPSFNPDDFYITVTKAGYCSTEAGQDISSTEHIVAEIFSAETIEAYGTKLWKLMVPWIPMDQERSKVFPLNIYVLKFDEEGNERKFAQGDVIQCMAFIMGRVLDKEEAAKCQLDFLVKGFNEDIDRNKYNLFPLKDFYKD